MQITPRWSLTAAGQIDATVSGLVPAMPRTISEMSCIGETLPSRSISVPGDPAANPMLLSGQVVHAYASAQGIRAAHASWDYADEAPLRDARGFEMGRGVADPSQPSAAKWVAPH
mgnify:CR=1 FL=1